MRTTPTDSIALILLPFALFFVRVLGDSSARTKLNGHKSQFVSFDTKGGEIEVSISKLTMCLNGLVLSGFSSTLSHFFKNLTSSRRV